MSEEHAVSYGALRARVRTVVESSDEATTCAATPEWTVADVVAHLVGVTDDVVNGRLEGVASHPWTDAQVQKRRGTPLADLLDEWDANAPAFETLLSGAPAEIAGQAVFDAATHEHDLRNAVNRPGARDSDAVAQAFTWLMWLRTAQDVPALRFVTEQDDLVAGVGEPTGTLRASRFEILRAAAGRRTAREIAALDWEGDADPTSALASAEIFTVRSKPLNEQ